MLQERVDSIKQAIMEDLRKGEENVFRGLVSEVEPNRLPEPIFVNYFLPGFLGNNPNRNWLLEWISVAGSPAAEVSIFDPATNQELFRVPPVLSSRNILLPRERGDLGDIFSQHKLMANTLGNQGTKYLFSELERKSSEAISSYHNDTNDRWIAIMTRYGYTPVNQQSVNGSQAMGQDDLFEY